MGVISIGWWRVRWKGRSGWEGGVSGYEEGGGSWAGGGEVQGAREGGGQKSDGMVCGVME